MSYHMKGDFIQPYNNHLDALQTQQPYLAQAMDITSDAMVTAKFLLEAYDLKHTTADVVALTRVLLEQAAFRERPGA